MVAETVVVYVSDDGEKQLPIRIVGVHVPFFVVAVEAFVHPGVIPFVAAQDAVEPVVANLMGKDFVQISGGAVATDDGNHRVFHAAAGAERRLQTRHLRVRINTDVVRVKTGGPFQVVRGVFPQARFRFGEHCPDVDHPLLLYLTLHLRARHIKGVIQHLEPFIRKPGKVMHPLRHVGNGLPLVLR